MGIRYTSYALEWGHLQESKSPFDSYNKYGYFGL